MCYSIFGSAISTYLVGFEDLEESSNKENSSIKIETKDGVIDITSPVEGECIELSEVKDDVFASKAMGEGIAVLPTKE